MKKSVLLFAILLAGFFASAKNLTPENLAENTADKAMSYFLSNKKMPENLNDISVSQEETLKISLERKSPRKVSIKVVNIDFEKQQKEFNEHPRLCPPSDVKECEIIYEAKKSGAEHIFTIFCDGKKSYSCKKDSDEKICDEKSFDGRFFTEKDRFEPVTDKSLF